MPDVSPRAVKAGVRRVRRSRGARASAAGTSPTPSRARLSVRAAPGSHRRAAGLPSPRRALRATLRSESARSRHFRLAGTKAQPSPCDQSEHLAVNPRSWRGLSRLGQQAETASQPTRLSTFVSVAVLLDTTATHRDLAHAELLLVYPRQNCFS